MTSRIARRRAEVELALVREGEGLKVGELARELGVSRWTVQRDVGIVRERWALVERATGRDLDGERARTAAGYEVVATLAWEQYLRLAKESSNHNAAVGYLRTALDALAKRAKLLGLEAPVAREEAAEGERTVVMRYVDKLGQMRDRPPWADSSQQLADSGQQAADGGEGTAEAAFHVG